MRFWPSDPALYLIECADLESAAHPYVRDNVTPLRETVRWAKEYLCRPHPQLGRKGPVCPFVQTAMDQRLFFLTVYREQPLTSENMCRVVAKYRDWFLELEPRHGTDVQFQTILILFPDAATDEGLLMIEATQERLKANYVDCGLMIGEFHYGPPRKPGLWNHEFRPLFSPVPLLAIRRMVPTDFPFLNSDARWVASYLRLFGDQVPPHLKEQVKEVVDRLGVVWGGRNRGECRQ